MIKVDSKLSRPGPSAWHISFLPSHVECSLSHSSPVSMQRGPLRFGETSPRLVDAKAATNGPLYVQAGMVRWAGTAQIDGNKVTPQSVKRHIPHNLC